MCERVCENIDLFWLQKAAGNFSRFFVTIFNRRLVHWRIFTAAGHLIVLK